MKQRGEQIVDIGEAKGRPMLHWVGKRPLEHVIAYPAQLVETFNPTGEETQAQGLLFHGDNKDVLAWLLANGYRGKVDLIYIDPPFDSGADYIRRVELRGIAAPRLDGEVHTLAEQIQYTDIWINDAYLQFVYVRLLLMRELLNSSGSICLHCDWHRVHHLQCILDEVFGAENFVNQLVWHYENKPQFGFMRHYPRDFDLLLVYAKEFGAHTLHHQWVPVKKVQNQAVVAWDSQLKKRVAKRDSEGNIIYEQRTEKYLGSVWTIPLVHPVAHERTGFPTQKPEPLLDRLLNGLTDPQDLVLDCFVGSGTTVAVAQKLGRRWIAADINKGAIQTSSKRLRSAIRQQIETHAEPKQTTLGLDAADDTPSAAALSFSVYRVNDYDLQIQHNEAVNLVVEHLGIDRTRTDSYFDGTQGKKLIKIIPFNHPLTPLDLQALKDELGSRPDEDRDVLIVCLGKETTVDPWLEDHNRHRPINKIDVIELRTDQKYGKFLVHEPAQADVAIRREGEEVVIKIIDFISPTIVKRLEMDLPLFKAQIPDWRAMVDVVLIDTSYDGEVFDITRSDVPERKNDLVVGEYRLPGPVGETTVAVKVIDMLGEEVLVVGRV